MYIHRKYLLLLEWGDFEVTMPAADPCILLGGCHFCLLFQPSFLLTNPSGELTSWVRCNLPHPQPSNFGGGLIGDPLETGFAFLFFSFHSFSFLSFPFLFFSFLFSFLSFPFIFFSFLFFSFLFFFFLHLLKVILQGPQTELEFHQKIQAKKLRVHTCKCNFLNIRGQVIYSITFSGTLKQT